MNKIIFKRDEPSMIRYAEETAVRRWKVWINVDETNGCSYEDWMIVDAIDLDDAIDQVYDVLGDDDNVLDAEVVDCYVIE